MFLHVFYLDGKKKVGSVEQQAIKENHRRKGIDQLRNAAPHLKADEKKKRIRYNTLILRTNG